MVKGWEEGQGIQTHLIILPYNVHLLYTNQQDQLVGHVLSPLEERNQKENRYVQYLYV